MKILFIGDIVGQPGREAVRHIVPKLKKEHNIDFTIANGENSAGGNGIIRRTANELMDCGIDVLTSGDHIWKNRETQGLLDETQYILRPANYPEGAPGKGYNLFDLSLGKKIAVINLLGRVFLSTIDCPFRTADRIIEEVSKQTNIIFIDFHAEATSEKVALGWYLDGKISCLAGTHTHIPTRDYRILPNGSAYITDVGMAGSHDSVIGVNKEPVIERFLSQLPTKFKPATEDIWVQGIIVTIDPETGKSTDIIPVDEKWM